MDAVFTFMSTDPEVGPKLREAEVPQRFEFPDVDLVVNIAQRAQPEDGQHLRWQWSDDVSWKPEVEMTMDSDVANRFFQGRENVGMAIARRRIKAGGNIPKALTLAPMMKPVFDVYRQLVQDKYPHLAV